MFKKGLNKMIHSLGYELHPAAEERASFANFVNLAKVYEHHLNMEDDCIEPNDLRIELLARLVGTPPSEAYFIVQAIAKCKNLDGDVCEFGVAQGGTSALIANEILSGDKTLHLFDSFEGLPKPTEKDLLKDDIFSLGSMEAYAGRMSCPEEMVRSRLKVIGFPDSRTVVHKGFLEQVLKADSNLPTKVSCAYLDFDFYEPIRDGLEFLHEITPSSAMVVVDDYDFFSTGAKTAVDEFIEEKNSVALTYECMVPNKKYGCFAVLTRVD